MWTLWLFSSSKFLFGVVFPFSFSDTFLSQMLDFLGNVYVSWYFLFYLFIYYIYWGGIG